MPGEDLLGTTGWTAGAEVVARVAEAFDRGEAVRLFGYNSDSDLCFQEVLVPEP